MPINKHSLEKTGFVKVDGGLINYRYYIPHDPIAREKTPLIYIHGGPGGYHMIGFDGINELANDRPFLFYDQLGSHLSPNEMTPELMTVERFSKEPFYLMEELSIYKAIFVGHSWGAVVGIEFALNYSEKVEGLILSSPLISTQRWVEDCNMLLKELPEDTLKTIVYCEKEGLTDSQEYLEAEALFSKKHFLRNPEPPLASKAHRGKGNLQVYNYMWGPSEFSHSGTLGDLNLFPRLKDLSIPTLIMTGEFDTATPKYMKEVVNEIKDSTLSIIPNSGHLTYLDNNDYYIKSVTNFLNTKFE